MKPKMLRAQFGAAYPNLEEKSASEKKLVSVPKWCPRQICPPPCRPIPDSLNSSTARDANKSNGAQSPDCSGEQHKETTGFRRLPAPEFTTAETQNCDVTVAVE